MTPTTSHLAPIVYAAVREYADGLTGPKCKIPRSVLACAMLAVVEELATGDPKLPAVTREAVAERAGEACATIAQTLDYDRRVRLDEAVSEKMGRPLVATLDDGG